MEIKISARHGHLADKTQEAIRSKVEKLSRFLERLTEIVVTVDLEHPNAPKVELLVQAEHRNDFVASDESGELMASLDAAMHKVEQQIKKYKDKVQKNHRTPGHKDHTTSAELGSASE